MKKIIPLLTVLFLSINAYAQKVEFKSDIIKVDGKDLAKVIKIKQPGTFGLVSSYELDALSGQKLVIAAVATDFVPDRNDNSTYYYRFTFLTTNQSGIFSLSKFGPEKSFAKLIGNSGIVVNDQLDSAKIKEFIALNGQHPAVAVADAPMYHIVDRSTNVIILIRPDNLITQDGKTIGKFKDVSAGSDEDTYEISIPEGLVIATVTFKGGYNATDFRIHTIKDNRSGLYNIPVGNDKVTMSSIDRNESTIRRIAYWLTKREYL